MAQVYLRESASVLCFYSSKPLFICKHSSVSQTKSNFCNIPGLPSPCGIWSTLHKLQALQSKNTTPLLIVANFLSTVISFKNISLNRKTSTLRKLVSTILLIRLPFLFFLPTKQWGISQIFYEILQNYCLKNIYHFSFIEMNFKYKK